MDKELLFDEDKKEIELSQSELYFEWWLEELKSVGLVLDYERPKSFLLMPPLSFDCFQHYKTKEPLLKQVNVMRSISYTPDYKVKFSHKLLAKLFAITGNGLISDYGREKAPGNIWQEVLFIAPPTNYADGTTDVYFDVKPPSSALKFTGRLASSRDFPIKQRLMWEKYGIFVNKVIPYGQKECLFTKTFLPKRYKWTDKSTKLRQLKAYEKSAKNLYEYLEHKNITL